MQTKDTHNFIRTLKGSLNKLSQRMMQKTTLTKESTKINKPSTNQKKSSKKELNNLRKVFKRIEKL